MSAEHRSLARLPLEIFTDLITREMDAPLPPHQLRSDIALKFKKPCLKKFRGSRSSNNGGNQNMMEPIATVGDLLKLSRKVIMVILDPILTYNECQELTDRICRHCTPLPQTVLSMLRVPSSQLACIGSTSSISDTAPTIGTAQLKPSARFLPSGVLSLDDALKGGVQIGNITEVIGRAGSGKTQLGLQLCTMVAGLGQGSIYIDTEAKISLQRLKEISHHRQRNFNDAASASPESASACKYKSPDVVLNNLTVHTPTSTNELLSLLQSTEEEILKRNQMAADSTTSDRYPVRLLVLDSIAAPTKRDFGSDCAPQRAAAVFKCAQMLKTLADQFDLAIVVINQVGLDANASTTSDFDGEVAVRAALGTSWHHCVTTRILLSHDSDPNKVQDEHHTTLIHGIQIQSSRRRVSILKSNVAEHSTVQCNIADAGLVHAEAVARTQSGSDGDSDA